MRKAITLIASVGVILAKSSGDDCGCGDNTGTTVGSTNNIQNANLNQNLSAGQQSLLAAQCDADNNQRLAASRNQDINQAQYINADDDVNQKCNDEEHEASGQEKRARSGKSGQCEAKLRISNHKSKEGELNVAEGLDHCGKVKQIEEMDEEVELAEHVQSEKDLCDNEKICKKKWVKRKHNRKCYNENCGSKKAGKIVKKRNNHSDKVDNSKFDGSHHRGGLAAEEKSYVDLKKNKNSSFKGKQTNNVGQTDSSSDASLLKASTSAKNLDNNLDINNSFFDGELNANADQNTNNNQVSSNTSQNSC